MSWVVTIIMSLCCFHFRAHIKLQSFDCIERLYTTFGPARSLEEGPQKEFGIMQHQRRNSPARQVVMLSRH